MDERKVKGYYALWVDAWRLFKQWAEECDGSDSFFEKAEKEAHAFADKHVTYKWLAFQLVMDILTELGRASAIEREAV